MKKKSTEQEIEPLTFEVEGAFIMDLARTAYWMELRRGWAKKVLGELQGITDQQIMNIINGDAILTGWARKRNGVQEEIQYQETEDVEYKKVIEERKIFLREHMWEVIPDRFISYDDLTPVLTTKYLLLRYMDDKNEPPPHESIRDIILQLQEVMKIHGFSMVEEDDAKNFVESMTQKYKVVDAAKLRHDVYEEELKCLRKADIRDEKSEEAERFIAEIDRRSQEIWFHRRFPLVFALQYTRNAIVNDIRQETLAKERNITPVEMSIEGSVQTQELFDCPNIDVGPFQIPEELVYKYAAVINSGGADRVFAHSRIFVWLTFEYDSVKRFFTTQRRYDDKPVLRPDDINIEIAQKEAEMLATKVLKEPNAIFEWYLGKTLATNKEAFDVFKCEIALDYNVRAIWDARTESIANRRKWEKYNG